MNSKTEVALSIVLYSLCSGTLVLLNKVILYHFPYPSLVIAVQLASALLFIYSFSFAGLLPVDPIRWKHVVPYLYYIVAFAFGVFCNMKSLAQANVETVIVFRALSPCLVAFLDALFLGREYPSLRSWLGLLVLVGGACGYAAHDASFQSLGWDAYRWPILYLCVISFEMAYGKLLLRSVDLKTRSGPVLYTNLLGLLPMLLFAAVGREYDAFLRDRASGGRPVTGAAATFLILGCLVGTGIGYSSWWCRDKVSATSFTLIGVINKCLTVLLNVSVWDHHASPAGILCLLVCLAGGSIYQQAPLRAGPLSKAAATAAKEVEHVWEDDITEVSDGAHDAEQIFFPDPLSGSVPLIERVKRRNAV